MHNSAVFPWRFSASCSSTSLLNTRWHSVIHFRNNPWWWFDVHEHKNITQKTPPLGVLRSTWRNMEELFIRAGVISLSLSVMRASLRIERTWRRPLDCRARNKKQVILSHTSRSHYRIARLTISHLGWWKNGKRSRYTFAPQSNFINRWHSKPPWNFRVSWLALPETLHTSDGSDCTRIIPRHFYG